ncbi:MAG: class I tRNA ligase family protein, partial [Rhodospirillales bacterium]|nr:class I tRNA ligase family protein [Rhodospirillales bacterium]
VTGFDIIFFWVARMMMMGIHFMGEVPFRDVYIHALVRDEKGQKMSKSKGNIIDPLDLIEKYGCDALRFTLAALAAQGRDIKLAEGRVEGYRNFATKLWNAARFCQMNDCRPVDGFDPQEVVEKVNRWIVGKVGETTARVEQALEGYKFNEAANAVYQFTWGTFCDWYLEFAKPVFQSGSEAARGETRATTAWVLEQILHLLHPFMPFITEELWEEMAPGRENRLITAGWPTSQGVIDAEADGEMDWLVRFITAIRAARSEMNVPPAARLNAVVKGAGELTRPRLYAHADIIKSLARLQTVHVSEDEAPKGSVQVVVDEATVILPLAGHINVALERARLAKERSRLDGDIEKIDRKLNNESFLSKAPPEIVDEQRERRQELDLARSKVIEALDRIAAL